MDRFRREQNLYKDKKSNSSSNQTETRYNLKFKFEFKAFILGGQMGESEVLSAYNEIGSSDFARVIQYSWLWDREERDQWER